MQFASDMTGCQKRLSSKHFFLIYGDWQRTHSHLLFFFFQLLIIFMNSRELYHNGIVLNIKLFLFHVDIIMLSALKIFFFAWKLSIVEIVKCFQKICKIWTTHWQKFKSMLSCSRPFLLCNKLAFLCNISYWYRCCFCIVHLIVLKL